VPKASNLLDGDRATIMETFLTNKETIPKLYEFIFRKDLPMKFKLNEDCFENELIQQ
jgi:hypothetical protein